MVTSRYHHRQVVAEKGINVLADRQVTQGGEILLSDRSASIRVHPRLEATRKKCRSQFGANNHPARCVTALAAHSHPRIPTWVLFRRNGSIRYFGANWAGGYSA